MRILSTTELWFPDYVGGSARVAREVATALVHRGHELVILAPAPQNQRVVSVIDGMEVHRVIKRSDMVPRTYTDTFMYASAARQLANTAFDVILGQHVGSMLGARLAFPSIPCAHVFHASGLREARQRRGYGVGPVAAGRSLSVEPALKLLEYAGARRADRLLVLSEFSRRLLIEDQGSEVANKIENVGGGVDTDRYAPSPDRARVRADLDCHDGETVLLTVRRLVQRMGLENLLAAFAKLHPVEPSLRLVVVGDGELRQRLRRQAAELGISGSVRWAGRVDDDELVRWYQAADLFVLPTSAYEGFGISTVEAFACGTPVVGTPVGATPEVLAPLDVHLIARDATPDGIADAIRVTLPRLSDEFRHRVRDHAVDALSWRSVVTRWEAALLSLRHARRSTRGR